MSNQACNLRFMILISLTHAWHWLSEPLLQFRFRPQTPLIQPRIPIVDISLHTSTIDLNRGAAKTLWLAAKILVMPLLAPISVTGPLEAFRVEG